METETTTVVAEFRVAGLTHYAKQKVIEDRKNSLTIDLGPGMGASLHVWTDAATNNKSSGQVARIEKNAVFSVTGRMHSESQLSMRLFVHAESQNASVLVGFGVYRHRMSAPQYPTRLVFYDMHGDRTTAVGELQVEWTRLPAGVTQSLDDKLQLFAPLTSTTSIYGLEVPSSHHGMFNDMLGRIAKVIDMPMRDNRTEMMQAFNDVSMPYSMQLHRAPREVASHQYYAGMLQDALVICGLQPQEFEAEIDAMFKNPRTPVSTVNGHRALQAMVTFLCMYTWASPYVPDVKDGETIEDVEDLRTTDSGDCEDRAIAIFMFKKEFHEFVSRTRPTGTLQSMHMLAREYEAVLAVCGASSASGAQEANARGKLQCHCTCILFPLSVIKGTKMTDACSDPMLLRIPPLLAEGTASMQGEDVAAVGALWPADASSRGLGMPTRELISASWDATTSTTLYLRDKTKAEHPFIKYFTSFLFGPYPGRTVLHVSPAVDGYGDKIGATFNEIMSRDTMRGGVKIIPTLKTSTEENALMAHVAGMIEPVPAMRRPEDAKRNLYSKVPVLAQLEMKTADFDRKNAFTDLYVPVYPYNREPETCVKQVLNKLAVNNGGTTSFFGSDNPCRVRTMLITPALASQAVLFRFIPVSK